MKKSRSVEDIVADLRQANAGNIEASILKPRLIRELYKAIGEPTEQDFKTEFKHWRWFNKTSGYTKDLAIHTAYFMENFNRHKTEWHINRPSRTKLAIVEDYVRDGWHCDVGAYIVTCTKYVKHPRYKDVWVCFSVTRDRAIYEYVLEDKNE